MDVGSFLALPFKQHNCREPALCVGVIRYPPQYLHEITTPSRYAAEFAELFMFTLLGLF